MHPRNMIKRALNTLAGVFIVQHNFAGAYAAFGVYLPKYGCAVPMFGGAYPVLLGGLHYRFPAENRRHKLDEIIIKVGALLRALFNQISGQMTKGAFCWHGIVRLWSLCALIAGVFGKVLARGVVVTALVFAVAFANVIG